jgi:methionyl-tRNA formyltransferase
MTIVFMGTSEFSVPTLRILLENSYDVCVVVTQPDRPKGRGQKVVPSPVKVLAERYKIPVLQPKKVRMPEVQQILRDIAPDVIVVVAYGQILPESILQIPKFGCINVHASLLPKYRGAAPIQWAIIQGETETGITTMFMDKGMDTGDMLLQTKISIDKEDTAGTLHDKLSQLGAELLLQTLQHLEKGAITPIPQNHDLATYAPLLKKENGYINWQEPAAQICDKVRGLFPWPGAYTYFQGKIVKLLKVKVKQMSVKVSSPTPGTVVALDNIAGPVIATGEGYIQILEIQPENKKPMHCSDFCRGYHLAVGDRLDT